MSSADTHVYRHSLTGLLATLTEAQASVFPDYLYEVPDDAKPFAPGLFKPGKVGEFQNVEPLTESEEAAQAELDAVAAADGPNSKAAKEAKANLAAAHEASALPAESGQSEDGK